jgi:hypothetical protein
MIAQWATNMNRATASQHEKYLAFKRAYSTISECQKAGNYLAAYVLAFSLIEDRVRALYVIWHRVEHGNDPTETKLRGSFADKVKQLRKVGDLSDGDAKSALNEAIERNHLLHAAMWSLDVFSLPVVERVMNVARQVDKARRAQKKKCGQ